jgi:hypothetical protein
MSSSLPRNIFSQTNSAVYVAVRVLQPRRQMKVLPKPFEFLGIFPVGYFARYARADVIDALPLIDASGLMSHEGVMYSSFWTV